MNDETKKEKKIIEIRLNTMLVAEIEVLRILPRFPVINFTGR